MMMLLISVLVGVGQFPEVETLTVSLTWSLFLP